MIFLWSNPEEKEKTVVKPHGFEDSIILKFKVCVTTSPARPFTNQVPKLAKELISPWEILLAKDAGVIPFEEGSKNGFSWTIFLATSQNLIPGFLNGNHSGTGKKRTVPQLGSNLDTTTTTMFTISHTILKLCPLGKKQFSSWNWQNPIAWQDECWIPPLSIPFHGVIGRDPMMPTRWEKN